MLEPNPITYRMISVDNVNPDAVVKCNCNFDEGHEAHCDIVAAYKVRNTQR